MSKSTRSLATSIPGMLVSFLALGAVTGVAMAETELTGMYAGLQYSDSSYELDSSSGADLTASWGHLKGKLGMALNSVLSVEGQLGLTNNTDSDQGVLTYGAYLRADWDVGQYKPYGLIGASGIKIYEPGYADQTESGGSYGVGVEIFGSKNISVTLEYLSLIDQSVAGGNLSFDLVGLGFTYYFMDDSSYFNQNRNKIQSIRD